MSSDPNKHQNDLAVKLTAAGRERDLRQRTDKVKEALQGLPDDDRDQVVDNSLRELAVHHAGS
jgi:hypothetical protein